VRRGKKLRFPVDRPTGATGDERPSDHVTQMIGHFLPTTSTLATSSSRWSQVPTLDDEASL